MIQRPRPQTAFEWPLYADATFAGLAVLFPIPLLDWALEEYFRRRMPRTIARHRRRTLPLAVIRAVNGPQRGCLSTGLRFLVRLPLELLKRIFRKLLYILTIKEATDQLSNYWQRAFLLDYALAAGHLNTVESARQAQQIMEEVLKSSPSPMIKLARMVLLSPLQVMRLLRRAFNSQTPIAAPQQQNVLRQQWSAYQDYLQALAERYQQTYQARVEGGPD
ncbi:MAG: hypothetical protein KJ077_26285 [Anaerolineae bacterium]|nr:hypothetical protein [Anaerolineae bacterium]